MTEDSLNRSVESICRLGCDVVRATIEALELGKEVPQVSGLSDEQRRELLVELRNIMAVYDARD